MRIGIVNDMPLAIEALRRALAQAPEHRIIWVARDGAEGVELCARETPDLVLMDLIMPGMDGVEATRRIMRDSPCTILIVTVSIDIHSGRVFEAMGHGALDAVDTPVLDPRDPAAGAAPLLAKIALVGKLIGDNRAVGTFERKARADGNGARTLVAIGASAGGPSALATLLSALPRGFPGALVIVQHVDEKFVAGMAEWLKGQSKLPMRLAEEGDRIVSGSVSLSGAHAHLVVKSADRLGYTAEPRDSVYRPSVDVFFESVSRVWPGPAVGVLLTGMGRDGARGLKAMRDRGHRTFAQDEATSAVYGMPKAAAQLGAADEILPLELIAPRLVDVVRTRAR